MVCKSNVNLRRQSLAKALFMGLAGLLTIPASAAETACAGPDYRAFDFWLGHWEVRLADGQLAGENRIQASADGCAIMERWQGARGSHGFSVNFYEPQVGLWRQTWVSAGSIIEISGSLQEGSMMLEGEIRYRKSPGAEDVHGAGPVRPFRGRWTPLPDGRVRQFFEELILDKAGEEKWQPWFEGFYAKAVE